MIATTLKFRPYVKIINYKSPIMQFVKFLSWKSLNKKLRVTGLKTTREIKNITKNTAFGML